jgi:hypothetical protein
MTRGFAPAVEAALGDVANARRGYGRWRREKYRW